MFCNFELKCNSNLSVTTNNENAENTNENYILINDIYKKLCKNT